MKRIKWLLATVLTSMLILSGCQSVGGLDINKTLVDSFTVKSSESTQTVSLEIVPTDGQISEEDKKIIDLLNSFSLNIDHAMVQDASTASVEGALSLNGTKTPFHLSMDKNNLSFWVDGAINPINIPLDSMSSMAGMDLAEFQVSTEQSTQLVTDLGEFFFKNAPNPESISVSSVKEEVYGEQLTLQNLHIEIRGDELVGLAKSFLTSISKDEDGVKELISTLYDVYYPVYEASLNAYGEIYEGEITSELEDPLLSAIGSPVEDKEATVTFLSNQLQKGIEELLAEYDNGVKEMFKEEPLLNELFSKDTVLAMDIMLDNKLQVRKQNVDLTIQIPTFEGVPVKQVKIHSSNEIWNVNKPVTVNKVDISKGALNIDMFAVDQVTPGTILRNFDNQSEVYRFLQEEMEITYKYFILDTVVDEDYEWYIDYPLPIEVNKTKMVPLRYVAEQLDAQMKWDASLKQTTIIDDITGSIIVVKNGSNQALIDGVTVKLAEPAMNYEGTNYVPLRFIADALGATVEWDNDSKTIVIERQ
ncbi:copper amine oxidase N-terminal domain-containing protein [Paenibacillus crassostreae]|uniref:Copper amine oxidase-like N-terminal domain-containing protein n=1 Tax=Paenibacillus crassostreae TaxID=1763538 RepID=A0A167GI38_9BACL|nr:copper amine oxidase N-terminal domain-containing protein [Paenibacillus crassostreae]AOZ92131.1 hypothetical protein LPB68_07765 [Paenibacillus crassostreae]OAB77592.1 hypothetical protein PNBC_00845 [Paenibacillus crassostreae]